MRKRGDINLWFLTELLGAILIGTLAVYLSSELTKGTIYEKLNTAKDIAMQINALASIPGDAYVVNTNLHGYSLAFSGNKIEVYEGDYDQYKGAYYFVKTGKSNFDIRLNKPKQVVISKVGDTIKISEEIPNSN